MLGPPHTHEAGSGSRFDSFLESFINPSSSTWIEQAATNRQVAGSNPARGTGVITYYGLLPMFCPYGLVGLGYRLLTAEVAGSNPVGGAVGLLKWWFNFI